MTRQTNFITAILALAAATSLAGVTNFWEGDTDADWSKPANWSENLVPADGHHVVIDQSATLTNAVLGTSSADLGSLVISNAMLTFSNWTTALIATNVTIGSGGVFTLPAAFTNGGMSNRIYITCVNCTVDEDGQILVDHKGYAAGSGPGVGIGTGYSGGGSYGGRGGRSLSWSQTSSACYASAHLPLAPGSGGGSAASGAGGGAVRIDATGTVLVDGTISANGQDATTTTQPAGGSGGGIYITCDTFGSSNGVLRANGGQAGTYGGKPYSGGGGGGRIAVLYASLADPCTPRFATSHGTGLADGYYGYEYDNWWHLAAGDGTVYLPDTNMLSETLDNWLFTDVNLFVSNLTSWSINSLTISNCSFTFATNGFLLTVENSLLIDSDGSLGIGCNSMVSTGLLSCGGDMILTNGGSLYVYSGKTNGVTQDHGTLVNVANSIMIGPSSWIYPYAHETDGGSVLFQATDLCVGTNGGINADAKGYTTAFGPGAGQGSSYTSGGGHGGKGGETYASVDFGGPAYGSTNAPIEPGSGGGRSFGEFGYAGRGGGLVRLELTGTATILGTISANGGHANRYSYYGGGGAGGGINITCQTLAGSGGSFLANGGRSGFSGSSEYSGGGAGGRIAINYSNLGQSCAPRFATTHGVGMADGHQANLGFWDGWWRLAAENGTVYLPDTNLLSSSLTDALFTDVNLFVSGLTAWTVGDLIVSNCSFRFEDGLDLIVNGDLLVATNGALGMGTGSTLTCSGNISLNNGASLSVHSARTNTPGSYYGALVNVAGNITIASNAWIYPFSDETNGGSVLFRVNDLTIDEGGGINASGRGFAPAQGYELEGGTNSYGGGTTAYGGGGGHGGKGGRGTSSSYSGGGGYDWTNAPAHPGSGGGGWKYGGRGGGVVRTEARGDITVNGTVKANGGVSLQPNKGQGGGGAGGSIFLSGRRFSGNGLLQADGADSYPIGALYYNGGGGGGRIAIWESMSLQRLSSIRDGNFGFATATTNHPAFTGTVSVTNGMSWVYNPHGADTPVPNDDSFPGSYIFIIGGPAGTVFMIR